jgi:hypothetical protein
MRLGFLLFLLFFLLRRRLLLLTHSPFKSVFV